MLGFDDLRLGRKLGLLVLVVMICATASSLFIADLLRSELLQSRLEELRALTDTATGIATSLQAQVDSGQLDHDHALEAFGARVRAMKYNGDQGYIFAYTMDGVTVASPDPRQIGTNRLDIPVAGRPVIREIRDAVQATGDAVIRYDYPRPGDPKPTPKISVATRFAPWNIFVGTGAYVDDLDARFWSVVRLLVGGLTGFLVVVAGLAWLISRRITRPLLLLQQSMKHLAEGDLHADVSGTKRRDEVGAMARAVLVLKEHAVHAEALEREQREARTRRTREDEQVRLEAQAAAAAAAASLVVGSIGKGLEALSAGDLTLRLDTQLPAEYEKLRTDFNAAMEQVADLVSSIVTITASIDDGSRGVERAADDLSKRTEQQAASLEQSAAALTQLTTTVRRTAESAMTVSQVVTSTRTDAQKSGEIVREAIGAMGNIERSSNEIGQIIGVIDEIAFQTSLLALNAGVEAARAGESGRGFAVVASEVRALAQRSADAAKQIKTLIATSAKEVSAGVGLVNEAGKSLDRIVTQVSQITNSVAEMAASAQEQATGLHEVNAAVNHMDRVTQQNAAMVEESTAASHALAHETAELVQLTDRFHIESRAAAPNPAARRPQRRLALSA